jgi:FixJ family two-component response regulator
MESDRTVFGIAGASDAREALLDLAAWSDLKAKVCGSVDEYLKESDSAQPGCVVLDISTTGNDEPLIALMAHHRHRPMILITGPGQKVPAIVEEVFFEVIEKPFRPEVLLDCIHRAMRHNLGIPI